MEKYATRRAIIRALYAFQNPQDFSTILGHHAIILAAQKVTLSHENIRDIRHEWDYLTEKLYLVPIPGYDDYRRLSGDLRSLLDAEDSLSGPSELLKDERLYGPDALGRRPS